MRRVVVHILLGSLLLLSMPLSSAAQDETPRIGPFVFDIRGSSPGVPEEQDLAASRGLVIDELPGRSLGLDLGAHVYPFTWKFVTFGLGAQLTFLRAGSSAPSPGLRAVSSTLLSLAPQVSFNFGTGNGWSYLSGGFGRTIWAIQPEGQEPAPPDEERLNTFNYGAGARWFFKDHLAFTFDIRWHAIDAGSIFQSGRPGSPRTTLLIMGAGISVK